MFNTRGTSLHINSFILILLFPVALELLFDLQVYIFFTFKDEHIEILVESLDTLAVSVQTADDFALLKLIDAVKLQHI